MFKKITAFLSILIMCFLVACTEELPEYKFIVFEQGNEQGEITRRYAAIEQYYHNTRDELVVPLTYEEAPVEYLLRSSFLGKDMFSIDLSNIKDIAESAFIGCWRVRYINFRNVENIAAGAFEQCKYLEKVELPASLISIGYDAFSNCENLKEIRFASNPEIVGDFLGDVGRKKVAVCAPAGGTIEAYAKKYGHTFVAVE